MLSQLGVFFKRLGFSQAKTAVRKSVSTPEHFLVPETF